MTSSRNSDGKRPLYGAQYFARLTQRLISALTVQTNYGVLYQVDMRLRPVGPLRSAGDADRRISSYQEQRGLDLGAHGADAGARRLRPAGFCGADRSGDPRRAVPHARSRARSPTMSSRCAARSPRKKATPTPGTSNTPPAASSISNSSRNICSSCMPRPRRTFSTPRRRACSIRRRVSACSNREDAEMLRPAVRLFHDLTQILRLCLPGVFDPKTASVGVLASRPRRRPAGFSPRSRPTSRNATPGARLLCANPSARRLRPCTHEKLLRWGRYSKMPRIVAGALQP